MNELKVWIVQVWYSTFNGYDSKRNIMDFELTSMCRLFVVSGIGYIKYGLKIFVDIFYHFPRKYNSFDDFMG